MKTAPYMNNATAARIAANTHLFIIADPPRLTCVAWPALQTETPWAGTRLTRPSYPPPPSLAIAVAPGPRAWTLQAHARGRPANPKPASRYRRPDARAASLTALNVD